MMFASKLYLSLVFILLPALYMYAQDDSLNTSAKLAQAHSGVSYFKENTSNPDLLFLNKIDTGLHQFQHYMCRYHLGNSGLPCVKQVFDPRVPQLGFSYWKNNYDNWMFIKDSVNYYHSRVQYTDARLVIGSKKEQFFSLVHTQNVNRNLNLAVHLRRVNSPGYYIRQSTNHNNIAASANYRSKNKRYFLLGHVIYNNLKASENGGIKKDSLFEQAGAIDRGRVQVNLESAAERRIKNKSINIKQYLHAGPKRPVPGDSLAPSQVIPRSRFGYSLDLGNDSIIYREANPKNPFYPAIYRDSLQTFDSIYFYTINNELSWKLLRNSSLEHTRKIGLGVYLKHQLARVKQNEFDSLFSNSIARAELFNFSARSPFCIQFAHTVSGNNRGDYFGTIDFTQFIKDSSNRIALHAFTSSRMPEFMFSRYSSNHFFWIQDFGRIGTSALDLVYTSGHFGLSLGFTASRHSNYIYFDQDARPVQLNADLDVVSAFIQKDVHLDKFTLANKITYQHLPDSSVIRLPAIVSAHSLFYENNFFKNAITARLGLDVFYNTAYMANAYMPATAQFFLQDEKKIGNYPYIDFFLNLKIKTARIFFKLEHLNAGLMEPTYYTSLHYPMPDRLFKFGISWIFID